MYPQITRSEAFHRIVNFQMTSSPSETHSRPFHFLFDAFLVLLAPPFALRFPFALFTVGVDTGAGIAVGPAPCTLILPSFNVCVITGLAAGLNLCSFEYLP